MMMQGFSCDLVSPANQISHIHSTILSGFCEALWNTTHAVTKHPTTRKPYQTTQL